MRGGQYSLASNSTTIVLVVMVAAEEPWLLALGIALAPVSACRFDTQVAGTGIAGDGASGAISSQISGSGAVGLAFSMAAVGGGASGATTGRWLSTLHYVTAVVGQQQNSHSYVYYETTQQGDSFTVTKGLECGTDASGSSRCCVGIRLKALEPVTAWIPQGQCANGACELHYVPERT